MYLRLEDDQGGCCQTDATVFLATGYHSDVFQTLAPEIMAQLSLIQAEYVNKQVRH